MPRSLIRLFAPVLSLLFLLLAVSSHVPARAQQDFLDPAVAFRFEARMAEPDTIEVVYTIAPEYYMYRERFAFAASGGVTLGAPQMAPGHVKYDPTFEKDVETYTGQVAIRIPVSGSGSFTLTATSQGCADAGLCYPPQQHQAQLAAAGSKPAVGSAADSTAAKPAAPSLPVPAPAPGGQPASATPAPEAATTVTAPVPVPAPATAPSELADLGALLGGGKLVLIIPAFIVLGLGLAFTPCVLPMLPILSSIIIGEGDNTSRKRGFILSLAYSLGMAIVYTLLGIAAGLAGEGLAAALQNPWVLGGFALLLVVMALSMFDLYQLQLPARLQARLTAASQRQQGGKLAGVFAMGAISALIVGPCVAAPLAGALVYISQTRDVVIGGVALFALAIGMSIPLLLVGLSAGTLLPRAGAWMDAVKRLFGVLMLGMALWLAAPVLPGQVQMGLWALLLIGYAVYLLRSSRHWAAIAVGVVAVLLGAIEFIGMASGGRDPYAPLAHLTGQPQAHLTFRRIKSVEELDAVLAAERGKTVLLDFYADWCVSCKEMEKWTFTDAAVQQRLANTVLLQADVTANDGPDRALLKRFGLFGPPGIILFDPQGREIPDSRVIGYQNAARFLQSLERLGHQN